MQKNNPSGENKRSSESDHSELKRAEQKSSDKLNSVTNSESHKDYVQKTLKERAPENRLSRKTDGRKHFGSAEILDSKSFGKSKNLVIDLENGLPQKLRTGSQEWQRDKDRPDLWHVKEGKQSFDIKAKVSIQGNDLIVKIKDDKNTEHSFKNDEIPLAISGLRLEKQKHPEIVESSQAFQPQKTNEVSNLSGALSSPDRKHVLKVDHGKIMDQSNKIIAVLHADGSLSFPGSKVPKANEDINATFHNYSFSGNDNGLPRSFVATSHMPDGKLFLAGQKGENKTECLVSMGMLIDAKTGKQIGHFVEPPSYSGEKLHPGKIALSGDTGKAISLEDPRFKDTVFDLDIKGQVFKDHRRLQGICTGDKNQPAFDLQQYIARQKHEAGVKDAGFQGKIIENTARAFFGDKSVYEEHQKPAEELATAISNVNEVLRTGKADLSKFAPKDSVQRAKQQARMDISKIAAPSLQIPPRPQHTEQAHKSGDNSNNRKSPEKADAQNAFKEQHTEKHEAAIKGSNTASASSSSIPELNAGSAQKVNGMLRIDNDVYHIKSGKLFKIDYSSINPVESKTPCGVLGPAYLYQMQGGKVESLADQNRVLMRFHIEGEKNRPEHTLLGLGASYINKKGEKVAGGLVSGKDLGNAAVEPAYEAERQQHESEARRNWFDHSISATLTSGFDHDSSSKIEQAKELAVRNSQQINRMFSDGFNPTKLSAGQFDSDNNNIRNLIQKSNIEAASSADLIQKHEITNTLIREGLITGALTAASVTASAFTEGAAAPVAAGNIAKGAELFSMARSLGTSAAAVAPLNAVLRFKEGKTAEETAWQTAKNLGDGVLQAAAMKLPAAEIKEIADLGRASNIAKSAAQTALFQAGQNLREKGSILPENSQEAGANLLSGTALAMFTQGLGSKLENLPVISSALKDADAKLARAVEMQARGEDAARISKLANEASVQKEIASYLQNAVHSGSSAAMFSGMPAIPEAVEQEKLRIEKELGKKEITASEFFQHMKLENMSAYVIERGAIAATTAAVFSGSPAKLKDHPNFKPGLETALVQSHESNLSRIADYEKPVEAAPKITDASRKQSNDMSAKGEIAGALSDGFTMAGAGRYISADGSFSAPWAATVVNNSDRVLNQTSAEAAAYLKQFHDRPVSEQAAKLTEFVANKFKNSAELDGYDSRKLADDRLMSFLSQNAGVRVELGEFLDRGIGGCTQQALLLKTIGDRLLPEANFKLVSGNGSDAGNIRNHVWIESGENIYDPRQEIYGENKSLHKGTHKAASEMDARDRLTLPAVQASIQAGDHVAFSNDSGWKVRDISSDGKYALISHDAAITLRVSDLAKINPEFKLAIGQEVSLRRADGSYDHGWVFRGLDSRTQDAVIYKPDAIRQKVRTDSLSRNLPEFVRAKSIAGNKTAPEYGVYQQVLKDISSLNSLRIGGNKDAGELCSLLVKYQKSLESSEAAARKSELIKAAPEIASKIERFLDGKWKPDSKDLSRLDLVIAGKEKPDQLELAAITTTAAVSTSETKEQFFKAADNLRRLETLAGDKSLLQSSGITAETAAELHRICKELNNSLRENGLSTQSDFQRCREINQKIATALLDPKWLKPEDLAYLKALQKGEIEPQKAQPIEPPKEKQEKQQEKEHVAKTNVEKPPKEKAPWNPTAEMKNAALEETRKELLFPEKRNLAGRSKDGLEYILEKYKAIDSEETSILKTPAHSPPGYQSCLRIPKTLEQKEQIGLPTDRPFLNSGSPFRGLN